MRDNGKGVSTGSGPGSPRGQPAWGGGCDRVSRLERNRLGCRVALNHTRASEDACAPVPVATARGTDLIGLIMIQLPKIILASASPRRTEILRTVGWPFETLAVDIDESRRDGEDAAGYVQRLALDKTETAAARRPELTVWGAGTTV